MIKKRAKIKINSFKLLIFIEKLRLYTIISVFRLEKSEFASHLVNVSVE